jgi:hypothetical protein
MPTKPNTCNCSNACALIDPYRGPLAGFDHIERLSEQLRQENTYLQEEVKTGGLILKK